MRLGGPGARQGRVPVPHSTAPFSLGGHPRGVAGMGPGLTRAGGGRGGGGMGGRGGSPQSPPGPLAPPPVGRGGGGLVVPALGGQPLTRGGALFPRPPPPFGCHTLVQALARAPCSPRCRRAVLAGRGGGGAVSAGGSVSGQQSAVSGLRGSGPPLPLVAPVLPPTGGRARPSAAPYGGGGVGRGARLLWGGRPAALSPSHLLALIAWANGARLSPASSLVWGLGLRRWLVAPAVAPVGEGVAQSPREPVVGIRILDAEHRPPLQGSQPRRLPVGPRRPNHRPEDPLVVLLGPPPPRGHRPVPPVPAEEHCIEGPVPHPPRGPRAGPAQPPVHLHHQDEGLTPQGVWDRISVPVPGPGPLCPQRRLPLRPLCPRRPAPPPPRQRPSAPAPPSAWGELADAGDEGVGGG